MNLDAAKAEILAGPSLRALERIVHAMDWTVLWYAHPGRDLKDKERWCAGVFTGPDGDLICPRHYETNEEAQTHLSPAGATPWIALVNAYSAYARAAEESDD